MKLSGIVAAATIATAAAFAPSVSQTSRATSLNAIMDRRAALGAAGAAFVMLPSIANADGAVSSASKTKAKLVYGSRIAALKDAVASGDFAAVASEKNAFVLFNSGTYATNKAKKAAAVDGTNAIFAAIRSQDKDALQSAYSSYVAANDIRPLPVVDAQTGQGISSDYSYIYRTESGTVYVR